MSLFKVLRKTFQRLRVSSQYSLKAIPAGVRLTARLLRKKSGSPTSFSNRWMVRVSPEGVMLHSRLVRPKWRLVARCLNSSMSLIFMGGNPGESVLLGLFFNSIAKYAIQYHEQIT
ncbi:MAG: hypothetical protein ACD_75C02241G0002 [uncultured bacterium]|nr:MAG: hypothetical protein ACD_75C02241G0002 [uncultured bacterium]